MLGHKKSKRVCFEHFKSGHLRLFEWIPEGCLARALDLEISYAHDRVKWSTIVQTSVRLKGL
jgi:hypothetical protein